MAGTVQPLVKQVPIVNSDGSPTEYFIRLFQEKQIDISKGITKEEAQVLIDEGVAEWASHRDIIAGAALSGGGNLSSDVTLNYAGGIADQNDVDLSTPPTDQQVLVWDDTAGKWVPADQSGSGGGWEPWVVSDTGTGSSQVISLPVSVSDEDEVLVFVNGIRYETSEYSVSGSTLTLTTNSASDSIQITGVQPTGTGGGEGSPSVWQPYGFGGPPTSGNTPGAYQALILSESSLVNYFPMDDAFTPTAVPVDATGSATATKVGPAILGVPGRLKNSTCLYSVSQGVGGIRGCFTIPRQIAADFSIECWILLSFTGLIASQSTTWYSNSFILGGDSSGVAQDFGFVVTAFGQPGMGVRNDTGQYPSFPGVSLLDGRWHHVVVTRNATSGAVIIYVDGGVVHGPVNMTTGNLTASSTLAMSSFQGFTQDLATYNSILTGTQVSDHYAAGTPY